MQQFRLHALPKQERMHIRTRLQFSRPERDSQRAGSVLHDGGY